ncbi:hypothetical protein KIPB_013463, partial [Kipferlia bialata]
VMHILRGTLSVGGTQARARTLLSSQKGHGWASPYAKGYAAREAGHILQSGTPASRQSGSSAERGALVGMLVGACAPGARGTNADMARHEAALQLCKVTAGARAGGVVAEADADKVSSAVQSVISSFVKTGTAVHALCAAKLAVAAVGSPVCASAVSALMSDLVPLAKHRNSLIAGNVAVALLRVADRTALSPDLVSELASAVASVLPKLAAKDRDTFLAPVVTHAEAHPESGAAFLLPLLSLLKPDMAGSVRMAALLAVTKLARVCPGTARHRVCPGTARHR